MDMNIQSRTSSYGATGGTIGTDYYDVLGIPANASDIMVREAYLRLKSTYSPNSAAMYSLVDDAEAQQMLRLIEEAYQTLNEDSRRREYDKSIGITSADTIKSPHMRHDQVSPLGSNDASKSGGPALPLDPYSKRDQKQFRPLSSFKVKGFDSESLKEKYQAIIDAHPEMSGAMLKELREAAGMSYDEMQEKTKVSRQYLSALEVEAFDQLPQVVYVKGFLRGILNCLGLPNNSRIVDGYSVRLALWLSEKKDS